MKRYKYKGTVSDFDESFQIQIVIHKLFLLDMSAWNNLFVPDAIMKGLSELGFSAPTPIQTLVLPSAIRDRMDIVGAAETVGYLYAGCKDSDVCVVYTKKKIEIPVLLNNI